MVKQFYFFNFNFNMFLILFLFHCSYADTRIVSFETGGGAT